jgi:hypothetical protein
VTYAEGTWWVAPGTPAGTDGWHWQGLYESRVGGTKTEERQVGGTGEIPRARNDRWVAPRGEFLVGGTGEIPRMPKKWWVAPAWQWVAPGTVRRRRNAADQWAVASKMVVATDGSIWWVAPEKSPKWWVAPEKSRERGVTGGWHRPGSGWHRGEIAVGSVPGEMVGGTGGRGDLFAVAAFVV